MHNADPTAVADDARVSPSGPLQLAIGNQQRLITRHEHARHPVAAEFAFDRVAIAERGLESLPEIGQWRVIENPRGRVETAPFRDAGGGATYGTEKKPASKA
jgi:hypothetical protein